MFVTQGDTPFLLQFKRPSLHYCASSPFSFFFKMKLSYIGSIISLLTYFTNASADSCQGSDSAIDECYMKIALNFALVHNPSFPFGALIVDHTKNSISCYGVNSVKKNALMHGETAAFWK